jgi:hypothetical protein
MELINPAWAPVKMEDVEGPPGSEDRYTIYVAAKKFSEMAVLKFADEHPEMDVTSRKLPFLFSFQCDWTLTPLVC